MGCDLCGKTIEECQSALEKQYGFVDSGSNIVVVASGELLQSTSSIKALPTTVDNLTIDDVEMEAFYASLDAETSVLSLSNDTKVVSELTNRMPSEDTQKALTTLQDLLTKDFSELLGPDEYRTMKDTLDHLSNLHAEDGISLEIRSLINEVSRGFTRWSCDYNNESRKIESTTAKLLKADEIAESLEANKIRFREVMRQENELCNELSCLEERMKKLEEQINAIKANISASESARIKATQRRGEIFWEGKMLKAQRDELREQLSRLRDELELAMKIQANIRIEWSKVVEKFNKRLIPEE